MRTLMIGLAATAAAAATFAIPTAAEAREGCGPGFHRGYYGHCQPNRNWRHNNNPGVQLVIGNWYDGRGYWDGRRYYQHRRRHMNAWRYW